MLWNDFFHSIHCLLIIVGMELDIVPLSNVFSFWVIFLLPFCPSLFKASNFGGQHVVMKGCSSSAWHYCFLEIHIFDHRTCLSSFVLAHFIGPVEVMFVRFS